MTPCAFAQGELVHALWSLQERAEWQGASVPLCPLGELGELGPDRRDIYDGFEVLDATSSPTGYPAIWGHDAQEVQTLVQQPNAYLLPLSQARPGRPLRDSQLLWRRAGNLLVAERMWLNTHRLVAVFISEPVLSNVWWPFRLHDHLASQDFAKALALWLNSALGLMLAIGNRTETRGAWVAFKKPTLSAMPVLDVRQLKKGQLRRLAQTFDALAEQPLLSLPQMPQDDTRCAIDEALRAVLGLPDLTPLREALAREPVVCLQPLRQRRR